ncbi:MAG: arginyltransferase [Gammaproteobacteria bacterium]|nr:arginyltransferase [Gammaproteobacteria bacterium]
MSIQQSRPTLYLSLPHNCSYLPKQTATTLFVDPSYSVGTQLYQDLLLIGFRRSGNLVYRPHCQFCRECVPVRIPVNLFTPNRSQKRIARTNQDITVFPAEPVFKEEHFELYRRYQARRHGGGTMDDPDPQKYIDFLTSRTLTTSFYEFRCNKQLLAVAVTDVLPESLSAVYTFFDPGETHRGLGVFAILWQIEQSKRLGLNWLYLGYWIKDCQKMAYKAHYKPLEGLIDGSWQTLNHK